MASVATRTVMPHGGSDERFVREPVPPGPEALFTFGRGPVVASRRRPAAELTSSLPKLARRSVCCKQRTPLLSVFTIKTRARTTQSRTRPAFDTPCQVVPKPGEQRELSPAMPTDGKPPVRNPNRAAEGAWPKPITRCRSLPLPKLVLSPKRGEASKRRCAWCA
jgi:hypothetical protein